MSTQSRPFSRRVVVSSVMEARNAHNLETLQSYGWKQAGALLPDSTHEPSVKRVVTLGPITLVEKVIHMAQADAQRRDSEWRPGVPTPGLLDRGDKRGIARGHRSSGFFRVSDACGECNHNTHSSQQMQMPRSRARRFQIARKKLLN